MSQLQQSDLTYLGAFKVPAGGAGNATFSYGGHAMAFDPAGNGGAGSLFIAGHDQGQQVAEVSIPAIVNSSNLNSFNTATLLQGFVEPSEGKLLLVNLNGSPTATNVKIGGMMIHDGELHFTEYVYYDASGAQHSSHFVRPKTLATTGQVRGPYRVGNINPGYVSGWMMPIPSEWQAALGGTHITGHGTLSILSRTSYGPAAWEYNPDDLTGAAYSEKPATPLFYYPQDHTTLGNTNSDSGYFNGATKIHAACFPQGLGTVLYFGKQGIGPYCYGTGTGCADPTNNNQGAHSYPYEHQVWAYDAADLAAVKAGTKNYWEPFPTIWRFNLPLEWPARDLGGGAYDPATRRIYLASIRTGGNDRPLIHVFQHKEAQMPKTVDVATQITTVPAGDFKVKTQLLDLSDQVIDEATSQPFNVPADPPSTPNVETPTVTVS